MEVTSEILPFFNRDIESKPHIHYKNVISKFIFPCPCHNEIPHEDGQLEDDPRRDEDGDYLVRRREDSHIHQEVTITLEHGVSTELKLVGLQIWRGALLLADYLIHHRNVIMNQTVLELGAGVGLTSVVSAMYAKQIICTDVDRGDILKLLEYNLDRNKEIIKAKVMVQGLDFFDTELSPEMMEKMKEISVILAADVIYDNDITEAFIESIIKMLSIPPQKTLYVALEKRFVFTISDLDCAAPCYEFLLMCLNKAKLEEPFASWKMEEISLDFPQYFNYERIKELVMFKISS